MKKQYQNTKTFRTSRGKRNNNPLNIIKSNNRWKGKILNGTDTKFEQFLDMRFGYRAGMIVLRTYITKYKLTSVSQIIERFAPSSENNTRAYISYVSAFLHSRGLSQVITCPSEEFFALVAAMAFFESNSRPTIEYLKQIYYDCC